MKSKATLIQIAKELGVSISTVSKALNGSPEISEPTKKLVQEYAKLKNYKPNVIGLSLKNRRTKTIGVIIPNILNSFFAKVFSGIEKVADEKGYFFAVLEAELIEISAVVKGSNVVTPTVSVTESKGAVIDTPTDIEPTIKVTPDFSKINFITIKTN